MQIIGILGIVLSLLAIIYFSVKGLNTLIGAPLAGLIVIIANQMDILPSLVGSSGSYIASLANFVIANFAIFLLGSLLAKYMDKSGATISISDKILNIVGTDKPYSVLLALFIIASLLTLGGISMFVVCFAIIPMARPLFKKLNLSWNLVTVPVFAGMATFTLSMFPGTPAMSNVIPSTSLGTTLTAAPFVGIVTSVIVIVYSLFYMNYALKKSISNGETYQEKDVEQSNANDRKLPSFIVSIIPVIALISIIILFSKVSNIVVIALVISILLSAFLFREYIPNQIGIINEGALASLPTTLTTGSTVAFGSLLTSAPAFMIIKDAILNLPGNPLISLSLATVLLSAITGSSVGSVGIAMESFAQSYIAMGVNPEMIHRIAAIAAGTFGIMPHTGLVITFNTIAGLNLKQSYKYQFMTVNVGHMIALVVALIMSMVL